MKIYSTSIRHYQLFANWPFGYCINSKIGSGNQYSFLSVTWNYTRNSGYKLYCRKRHSSVLIWLPWLIRKSRSLILHLDHIYFYLKEYHMTIPVNVGEVQVTTFIINDIIFRSLFRDEYKNSENLFHITLSFTP